MARTINQIKGDRLEEAVRLIEMLILGADPNAVDSPIKIECKKIIIVEDVKHEIDIYISVNNGHDYIPAYIFECKNWRAKVDKNEIIVFAQKIRDSRAQQGFFVARRFTSNAVAQAKRDRIELVTAKDVIDTLPPFLDEFHILGNKVIDHETYAKFNVKVFDPQMVGFNPGLNFESFAEYKCEGLLLGKVVERLQMQIVNEYMNHQPTATFDEEKRRFETSQVYVFADEELIIEGLDCQSAELRVVWESQVVRPPIISQFDIKTRGRVITRVTDKSPLGGSIQISFISTYE